MIFIHETIHSSFHGALFDSPEFMNNPGSSSEISQGMNWSIVAKKMFGEPLEGPNRAHHNLFLNLLDTFTHQWKQWSIGYMLIPLKRLKAQWKARKMLAKTYRDFRSNRP